MARTRTTRPTSSRPSASASQGQDRTLYSHNLWLNYLKPVSIGLVVSPNALRTAQIELPLNASDARRDLEALTVPRPPSDDAPEADDPAAPARILADPIAFLTTFLRWRADLLECYRPGDRVRMADRPLDFGPSPDRLPTPEGLRHDLAQYDDALEPTFAYRWPSPPEGQAPWCLLGLELPDGVEFDRKPTDADDASWNESPQKKFERLLYETRIPLGLIVAPHAVRVVYRPEAEQSGFITFPVEALLASPGRIACSALRELLKHDRLHKLPSRQRLHHILAESRKYQNEVSTQLAEQVLAALFALLKGFEAADAEARGRILRGLRDRDDRTHVIYEGLLTVLMRLVFLLYAEERELLPVESPLFARNYALAGLFSKLAEDEARHPDTMDQRFGAWASLIALFRVVHDGLTYRDPSDGRSHTIPPRKGDLFDPDRFPFLEGRPTTPQPSPPIAGEWVAEGRGRGAASRPSGPDSETTTPHPGPLPARGERGPDTPQPSPPSATAREPDAPQPSPPSAGCMDRGHG